MPRKPLIRSGLWPYHVTARCNNREPFPCSMDDTWQILTQELFVQAILHDLKIHAFVLMPNHFHLLLSIPSGQLDRAMKGFMESTTRLINSRTGRTGHVYGGRYYWSIIQTPTYFAHAIKYVYRNPLKALLSTQPERYIYSTFREIYGNSKPSLPIGLPCIEARHPVLDEPWDFKTWIETPYETKESELVRKALRKKEFSFSARDSTKLRRSLENQIPRSTEA